MMIRKMMHRKENNEAIKNIVIIKKIKIIKKRMKTTCYTLAREI
jgi:hypothetical protein